MHDELEARIVQALRAEADSLRVTVTPEQIEARLSRSARLRWLAPALVMVSVVALMVTVAVGVGGLRGIVGSDASEQPQAADLQVWPDEPLPPPYDWAGVRQALHPRGLILEPPTEPEAARASVDLAHLLAAVERHLADDPGTAIVGVHLGLVTSENERGLELTRQLVYVVETTGHATGNCIELWSASGDGSILGACFYPNRAQPPLDDLACAVTQPDPPFVPPSPYPAVAPPLYESDWYGSEALWTMLDRDGEVWGASAINLGEKTFWWSTGWRGMRDDPSPALTVVGTQLDGPGTFTAGPATNAERDDFGEAMLVGLEVPTPGCWQIEATYGDAVLSYVVWIKDE